MCTEGDTASKEPLGGCCLGGRSVGALFEGGAAGILSFFFSGVDAGDMWWPAISHRTDEASYLLRKNQSDLIKMDKDKVRKSGTSKPETPII